MLGVMVLNYFAECLSYKNKELLYFFTVFEHILNHFDK